MKKVLPKHAPQAPLDDIQLAQTETAAADGSFAGIDPDRLYSTREAADVTDMTTSFYEARRPKDLPPRFLRLGRCVKYLGRDLIAFLKGEDQTGNAKGGDNE